MTNTKSLRSISKICSVNGPALVLSQEQAQFLANHMVRKRLVEAMPGEPCVRVWLPIGLSRSVKVAVTVDSWVSP